MLISNRFTEITKAEFCKHTRTSENCWMFEKCNREERYILDSYNNPEIYMFDDGSGKMRLYKDMPQYGEIWMCVQDLLTGRCGLWSTWTVYN